MARKGPFLIASAAAGLLLLPTAQADAVTKGQIMASNCLACHGSQGQGPGEMPAIRDFTEKGLINRLQSFREGKDPSVTVMDRHAKGYSDAELRAIAKHITNLE